MTFGYRLIFSSSPASVVLEAFELPTVGSCQVLVRNSRTHVSAGSEMNFLRYGPVAYGLSEGTPRANIGYMTAGRIIAAGAEVDGFAVGDRVFTGGSHASHTILDIGPTSVINHIPVSVSDDTAGFAALGEVALHGVRRACIQIEQSVVVFGAGMVGQLVMQFARLSGAYPIVAVDLIDGRLAKAEHSGATQTINATRQDVVRSVKEITQGRGCDVVIHCSQKADILQQALECAADRGSVVLTGSPPGTAIIRLQEEILRKELRITGTYTSRLMHPHPYWGWTPDRNRQIYLRLLASEQLEVAHLISHVVSAKEAPEIYTQMLSSSENWLGVVFDWGNRAHAF